MPMKLNYNNLVFFDLKTDRMERGSIVEIGAVDACSGDEFEAQIEFDEAKADAKTLELNGYDPKRWVNSVGLEQGLGSFMEFLRKHATLSRESKAGKEYRVAALAGFNVYSFDKPLLTRECKRLDMFMPCDMRFFDVYELAMWRMPNLESYTLPNLIQHIGLEMEGQYALAHARAALELARNIVSRPFKFRPLEWAR